MSSISSAGAAHLARALLSCFALGVVTAAAADPLIVGYFTEWGVYQRQFRVKDLETTGAAERLDVLAYAFARIGADDRVAFVDPYADYDLAHTAEQSVDGVADIKAAGALLGNFNQLRKLKARHPRLRVVMSIGGWTMSDRFSDMALSAGSRQAFAASCVDRLIRGNFAPGLRHPGIFDGIDIDWEYPGSAGSTQHFRAEDPANFTALLHELRAQLDRQGATDGRHYSLSAALPGNATHYGRLELAKLHADVDFIDLMAYDFHGAWETVTGFQAALSAPPDGASADRAVRDYLAAGIPAAKLNLGVPFYGRGWQGVPPGPRGDGLRQTATGGAPGTYESGIDDFRALARLDPAYATFRDPVSGACWRYNPDARIFWSYDDAETLRGKLRYVVANGLGGVMCWDLGGDDAAGTLIHALRGAAR
jgi:chitinase